MRRQCQVPSGVWTRVWTLGIGILLSLNMNPAFELLALPAAGARIVRIHRWRRARLAADARVSDLVQREQRNRVLLRVGPDIPRRPGRQRTDPRDHLAARKAERLELLQVRACRR